MNDPVAFLLTNGRDPNNTPWEALRDREETGPGFQFVDIKDARRYQQDTDEENCVPPGHYIVFNCEFFVERSFLEEEGLLAWPQKPSPTYEAFMLQFQVRPKTRTRNLSLGATPSRNTLVMYTRTTAGETYWRLSAYANDRRITEDRRLVKDSYVTSNSDIEVVGSGFAAVGRYALPNPFPSIYAFAVRPRPGTRISLGTVRPNFGHAGGGVEGVLGSHSGRYTVSNHVRVLPTW